MTSYRIPRRVLPCELSYKSGVEHAFLHVTPASELSPDSKPPNGVSAAVVYNIEYSLSENINSYAWNRHTLLPTKKSA